MATHQCLHGSVESMSVVSPELGVGTLKGRVSVGLGLLDTAGRVSLASVSNYILHASRRYSDWVLCELITNAGRRRGTGGLRTRSCGSSSTDYAARSSWTLFPISWSLKDDPTLYVLAMATDVKVESAV
jgi:hypothetical protein